MLRNWEKTFQLTQDTNLQTYAFDQTIQKMQEK